MLDVCCHPLDVLAIIATITLFIIIIRGLHFRFPLASLFGVTLLELLPSDVLLLPPLLAVQLSLTFLSEKTPHLTFCFILLH